MKKYLMLMLMSFGFVANAFAENVAVDSEKLIPWLEQQVTQAKKGNKTLVTIPVVFRGPYGCVCPLNFVGVPSSGAVSGNWLEPVFKKVAKPKYSERDGLVIVANGYFTGKTIKNDLRKFSSPDNLEAIYQLKEFVVESYEPFKGECPYDIDCNNPKEAPSGCCAIVK